MRAKITRKFPCDGRRYFPGDVAEGRHAGRAIAAGCGVEIPEDAKKAPANKAGKPSENKGDE